MKPGDLIEWVYQYNSHIVYNSEQIWSTPMNRWIPIGVHPMMLISITDEFYTWLTPKGLFSVRVNDTRASRRYPRTLRTRPVVPRVQG
jgi:hypothetical protein